MPAEPIKFRCVQCNKLLGVSAHKVGETVHCPKCGAEVVVPEPESEPAPIPPPPEDDPDPSRIFRDMFRVDPPSEEFPDFSPADIRVEPGFEPPIASGSMTLELTGSLELPQIPPPIPAEPAKPKRNPRPAAPTPVSESGFPIIRTEPVTLRPEPPRKPRPEPAAPAPAPLPEIRVEPTPLPSFFEAPTNPPSTVARITVEAPPPPISAIPAPAIIAEPPPIRAEPSSSLVERSTARRSDVVLPRTAVLLWSFFVVLALVSSFAAGLLAGHYVWVSKAGG